MKKGSIFAPRNKNNKLSFEKRSLLYKTTSKNILKILQKDVVGMKKGFYICTRLAQQR
ncbi:hypothetical protein [Winogradskyella bathintestinalis]|uniref:hypothetical protein n=1 Tax=Winogradskyella bathintestinalis TaxID=3035208 RepID=UPI0025B56FE3|nr:hypothetical protein [Winogradskyella bathintestinalis]